MGDLNFVVSNIELDDRTNPSFEPNCLGNLTLISQNLNSFNLSSIHHNTQSCDKFTAKLNHIMKFKPSIIFLQDLRLKSCYSIVKQQFNCRIEGNFECILNSTGANRGTGICFNKNIDYKILSTHKSTCDNALILEVIINNFKVLLCSIYAPPQTGNNGFFPSLKNYILSLNNPNFFIFGDMNACPSLSQSTSLSINNSLDIINMTSIPNPIHSKHLFNWVKENFCFDAYRTYNPNTVEFSYVPFSLTKTNRSRIDLCLVAPPLINVIDNIKYNDSKLSILDHKAIVVNTVKKRFKQPTVDSSLLKIKGLYESVKYEIYETILEHYDIVNKFELQQSLVSICILSRELFSMTSSLHRNDNLVKQWIIERETMIDRLCSNFPSVNDCYNHHCNINAELFLDTLINKINNCCISFQSSFIKSQKKEKYEISKQLLKLKNMKNIENKDLKCIFDLESKLTLIENEENLRSISNSKHFNILNSEKGSKSYSRLLNKMTNQNVLGPLRNDEGQEFNSNRERDIYLVNHFKNKFETAFNPSITIEQFLGEHYNHPLCNLHKLSNDQKNDLDLPISLDELDLSLATSNLKSSPGGDGISIKLIHEFWDFLRVPLLNAVNYMITKGKLSQNMRNSKTSLLKKSGSVDSTKIKNLRPIGNLNACYKLFSGVISNRLEKVMHTITHKSQKAYSKINTIQEGILHTYELISKTLDADTSMSILSLDFSSAFDNLSHNYIIESLKFANFGNFFISLVTLTLTERFSCISTPEGVTSFFKKNNGTTQGDRPSPDIFKIGLNPLLLKLTLSSEINLPREIQFNIRVDDPKPDKVSAFADDANVFSLMNVESLRFCTSTLKNFGKLSGLCINNSKTKVCPIGQPPSEDFLEYCNNTGYQVVNKFTMLGITFDNKLEEMDKNWDKVIVKMQKITRFWNIFNLSVVGKINITKCFILPQLNYVGSICTPSNDIINIIEDIITKFINYNSNISKEKIFSPTNQGGLGIPQVAVFLKSLDILLFKKSLQINDTWPKEIQNCALVYDNPLYFIDNLNKKTNPVLHRIISSFISFQFEFWVRGENLRDMRIFQNKYFVNQEGGQVARAIFTMPTWSRFEKKIKCLKFADILNNHNHCLNFNEFKFRTEIDLSLNEFFRLQTIFRFNIHKYREKLGGPQKTMSHIFSKRTVKSKYYRKYFEIGKFNIEDTRTTKNRYLWANQNFDLERELAWQSCWTLSFLPMELKNFSLKLLNNLHKLNAHQHHFVANTAQDCSPCTLSNLRPTQKETLSHFFVNCPVNNNLAVSYFSDFLQNQQLIFDSSWFLIGAPIQHNIKKTFILNIEILLVCYFFFNCRAKQTLPLMRNLQMYIGWNRKLFFKNSRYEDYFNTFSNPFDPG